MAEFITYSNDVERKFTSVQVLSDAATLTAANTGTTYILSAAAGTDVTLPAPFSGANFKFIVGSAFATSDWTIASTTNVIEGNAVVAGAHVAASNENTISFVASAESIGDYVELVSDGTSWFVSGSGVTSGSITFTAV